MANLEEIRGLNLQLLGLRSEAAGLREDGVFVPAIPEPLGQDATEQDRLRCGGEINVINSYLNTLFY